MDTAKVKHLTNLNVFLTGNNLIVTPVILLVIDHNIFPTLNPSEVTALFSMPLAAFLYSRPQDIPGWDYGLSEKVRPIAPHLIPPPPFPPYLPPPSKSLVDEDAKGDAEEASVGGKQGSYYGWRDVDWGQTKVRMHRFLTGREGDGVRPVYGLTAYVACLPHMLYHTIS